MSDAHSWFSRARLRPDASLAALRKLLVPDRQDARTVAAHRLVWTLFADSPDRRRDFLWREGEPGAFYVLSAREPHDAHGLFDLSPPKPYVISLAAGDRLEFSLRANATVARGGPGKRGSPCDVVMDALYRIPAGIERASARASAIESAALRWFTAQGDRNGFSLAERPADHKPWLNVLGHRVIRIDRGKAEPARFGVLDLEGVLEVRDPRAFSAALLRGFGRAKAFGCGLMLIRRQKSGSA